MAHSYAIDKAFDVANLLRRATIATFIFTALCSYFSAEALSEEDPLKKIPAANDTSKPLYLTGANLNEYQDLLIAPLANLVGSGLFSAKLVKSAGESWSYSPLWLQASRENERAFKIGAGGEIVNSTDGNVPNPSFIGFPFGLGQSFISEPDAGVRGQKILWNISAIPGIDPQALLGVEFLWFGRKAISRHASGVLLREYLQGKIIPQPEGASIDPLLVPKFNTPVEWRELLQLQRPPVIFGFSILTYRYRSLPEDDYWIFSPVLGRSRRSPESNRSDLILEGQLSPDDFFVFSGKPSNFRATVVAEKTVLVPFPQSEVLKFEAEQAEEGESIFTARGPYRNKTGQNSSVLWNADNGSFVGGPGWIPTTIELVPRKLWVVEVNPKDPFSSHGTEILFVDEATQIPFYKVIYDKKGRYSRFIMSAWNFVIGADERIRFPAPVFILAIDRTGDKAQAIETQYVRRLMNDSLLKKKLDLLFDIREHDKRAPKKENTSATPAPEGGKADE